MNLKVGDMLSGDYAPDRYKVAIVTSLDSGLNDIVGSELFKQYVQVQVWHVLCSCESVIVFRKKDTLLYYKDEHYWIERSTESDLCMKLVGEEKRFEIATEILGLANIEL